METNSSDLDKILSELQKTSKLLNKYLDKREVFIRGILNGLGGILGATVVLAMIIWVLTQLEFVPIVGSFAVQVSQFINQNQPSL